MGESMADVGERDRPNRGRPSKKLRPKELIADPNITPRRMSKEAWKMYQDMFSESWSIISDEVNYNNQQKGWATKELRFIVSYLNV
jgi:hypothetical protein